MCKNLPLSPSEGGYLPLAPSEGRYLPLAPSEGGGNGWSNGRLDKMKKSCKHETYRTFL